MKLSVHLDPFLLQHFFLFCRALVMDSSPRDTLKPLALSHLIPGGATFYIWHDAVQDPAHADVMGPKNLENFKQAARLPKQFG